MLGDLFRSPNLFRSSITCSSHLDNYSPSVRTANIVHALNICQNCRHTILDVRSTGLILPKQEFIP